MSESYIAFRKRMQERVPMYIISGLVVELQKKLAWKSA